MKTGRETAKIEEKAAKEEKNAREQAKPTLHEPRPYQAEIIEAARRYQRTMVILPTGTGKTLIAFYLLKDIGQENKKALMMAPTKPLVEQHYRNFTKIFGKERAALITGEVPAKKRAELYNKTWIFATPQTVNNDVEKGRLDIGQFSLIVFDESHRAVGDYAYAKIGRAIKDLDIKVLALTASPGSKKEHIMEVVKNLDIDHIEIKTEEDLEAFLARKSFRRIYVPLPATMMKIRLLLKQLYDEYKSKLQKVGIRVPFRKGELIALGNRIMNMQGPAKFGLMKLYVPLIHLQHMLELLETQGLGSFVRYAEHLREEGKSTTQSLIKSEAFLEALVLAKQAREKGLDHPKMEKLLAILKELKGMQAIVFVQYTDQIKRIVSLLKEKGFKAEAFMGKKHGFNKNKQREIMDAFRKRAFDILVSSSIGEEGIDVPSVDAVIFYEPIPSEIRSIQRKGRTARVKAGEIIFLITRGTRDEAYFYASSRSEKRMKYIIESIKGELRGRITTMSSASSASNDKSSRVGTSSAISSEERVNKRSSNEGKIAEEKEKEDKNKGQEEKQGKKKVKLNSLDKWL